MTMLTVEFKTMGCHARAVLDAEGECARAALDRLPAWFARREHVLSRFDPESALARLNAHGTADRVDDVLWEAIDVALGAAAATDGLVTPTILSALEAVGYDRTFDRMERDQPGPPSDARAVPDWRTIERDARTRSIRLLPGLRLDLGGTAKGWTADIAARSLARIGPALVDVGGDVAMSRSPRDGWPIAIADPRGRRDALDLVVLRGGGIATSGRDFRRWKRSGLEQHHLIDPRTGAPSRTDVLSATVIAPRALDAEIAAKRVLLDGSRRGLAWIESHPELAALIVRDDGLVLRSAHFDEHAWKEVA
jgi:thiamine biosynthesis lipoprotein